MLKNEAFSSIGGSIKNDQIPAAVNKYEKYHAYYGGEEQERTSNYADMVNKYYDLGTSLYEYGWGQSFHFAPRWRDESVRESLKRHQHFFASQLGLKPGQKVLDVGCGIGGPLREIARFSSASITGLNNNEFQIVRGKELNQKVGLDETCDYVKADFMEMPFPENSFDAVYALPATCHAPNVVECYKEIYKVLKPGQCFALGEWCLTDAYDANNQEHQKIKVEIELGNSLPDIRTTKQCYEALEQAGFEVLWDKDLALDSELTWYSPVEEKFIFTPFGRVVTKIQIQILEAVGIAPKGTQRVQSFMLKSGDGLVQGGRRGIFTAVYFVLARKPLIQSQ